MWAKVNKNSRTAKQFEFFYVGGEAGAVFNSEKQNNDFGGILTQSRENCGRKLPLVVQFNGIIDAILSPQECKNYAFASVGRSRMSENSEKRVRDSTVFVPFLNPSNSQKHSFHARVTKHFRRSYFVITTQLLCFHIVITQLLAPNYLVITSKHHV